MLNRIGKRLFRGGILQHKGISGGGIRHLNQQAAQTLGHFLIATVQPHADQQIAFGIRSIALNGNAGFSHIGGFEHIGIRRRIIANFGNAFRDFGHADHAVKSSFSIFLNHRRGDDDLIIALLHQRIIKAPIYAVQIQLGPEKQCIVGNFTFNAHIARKAVQHRDHPVQFFLHCLFSGPRCGRQIFRISDRGNQQQS